MSKAIGVRSAPKYDDEILKLSAKDGLTQDEIALKLGIGSSTVYRALKKHGHVMSRRDKLTSKQSHEIDTRKENGNEAEITKIVSEPIRTLAQLIEVANINESVWYVDSWECGAWTVGMKLGRAGEERVTSEQQYRVKAKLKRIARRSILQAVESIIERMRSHAPKYPDVKAAAGNGEPCMGVFGLFDAHFGKLAWAAETGQSYDLKIADTIYRNAIVDLVNQSKHRNLTYAVMPLGNDFFHIDNMRSTTTSGTQVDSDGRFAKVIETGKLAFIWAVEQIASICPVYVPAVPGNHDWESTLWMAQVIHAWFHRNKRVITDLSPSPRKYVAWGCNLIGLTHGHQIGVDKLPSLMATEKPDAWAASTCREWLIAHGHRSQKWVSKPVSTHEGTTIRMLNALTATDAWHHANGFVGTRQAAEVYWYGRSNGYCGHAVVGARMK